MIDHSYRIWFAFLVIVTVSACAAIDEPEQMTGFLSDYSKLERDTDGRWLYSAANTGNYQGYRDYVVMQVFLDTGIRLSELIGLRITDIDFDNRLLTIMGKGRKQRLVPIGSRALPPLIREDRGIGIRYVFRIRNPFWSCQRVVA